MDSYGMLDNGWWEKKGKEGAKFNFIPGFEHLRSLVSSVDMSQENGNNISVKSISIKKTKQQQ